MANKTALKPQNLLITAAIVVATIIVLKVTKLDAAIDKLTAGGGG